MTSSQGRSYEKERNNYSNIDEVIIVTVLVTAMVPQETLQTSTLQPTTISQFNKSEITCVVDAKAAFEHLLQPQDLR